MERSIKELLIILRDNARVKTTWFGLRQRIFSGLCNEVRYLAKIKLISISESFTLRDYLIENASNNSSISEYWWKPRLWKPRLKWLNEQIDKL